MMPNLSVRNSTLPPLESRTARATSLVTVPDFGFGIRPRGPSGRPPRARGPRCHCRPPRPPPSWPPRCTFCPSSSALLDDLQAHRPGGSFDHLHSRVRFVCVQVLALQLHDLAQLLPCDAADLFAVRLRRAFIDTGGTLQQLDRGRRLEHEGEAAVLEDGDQRRHDITGLLSRALVVGLGELHDVDAVRAKRGSDRRRRSCLAGLQLELEYRSDLLLTHTYLYVCVWALSAPSRPAAGRARPASPGRTC